MKETEKTEVVGTTETELPAPQGIGMAVAFDWGLAAQILLMPIVFMFFGPSNATKISGFSPNNILLSVISVLVGIGIVLFGEMIRSGRNWALRIQIGVNALLTLVGLLSLVRVYQGIRVGDFWPVVTAVILLVFSPLIVWRLSRPATILWFKNVPAAAARKRHGGMWVVFIALWAIVGGILQILAAIK